MKKKRILIVILAALAVFVAVSVSIWLFSDKVTIKKSTEKGVLVNVDTWEVIDNVEVEVDGRIIYDSKSSNKISTYNGRISVEYLKTSKKKESFNPCIANFTPLYNSRDKRGLGSIVYYVNAMPEFAGSIYTFDKTMNMFILDLYEQNEGKNMNLIKSLKIMSIISKENNASISSKGKDLVSSNKRNKRNVLWEFEPVDGAYCVIRNRQINKVLEAVEGNGDDFYVHIAKENKNHVNQLWYVQLCEEGTYRIRFKENDYCLEYRENGKGKMMELQILEVKPYQADSDLNSTTVVSKQCGIRRVNRK